MIRTLLAERRYSDGIAVIEQDKSVSYRTLSEKAAALQAILPKGKQHIALFLPDGADYLAAFFGVLSMGLTLFPLNTKLTVHELSSLLTQADVSAVVTNAANISLFEKIRKEIPLKILIMDALPAHFSPDLLVTNEVNPKEPMVLLATSGTTGQAKIVQLSEQNVAHSTYAYVNRMRFTGGAELGFKVAVGAPFFSAYGLLIITAWMSQSFPLVVLNEAFTLDMMFRTAERHRVTHYEGGVSVALLMKQMAGRRIPYDISSLGYFGLAGSTLTKDTLQYLTNAYPTIEFWPGYGMTEASPLITKPDKKVNLKKLDSVGTGISGMKLLIDADGALTDRPGVLGEIVIQGDNVMLGYYKNPKATEAILKNGFLHTGDIGYLDEEGYLYLSGRKKNIIIVRGFNIHPEEVEACILASGLVKECIVYGKHDGVERETVAADVVPQNELVTEKDILLSCKEHLAPYKCPVHIRLVEALEKTATGKIKRPSD